MKIALLVGANPRTSEGGPWIKLSPGKWKISCPDVVDSVLLANHYISERDHQVGVGIPSSSFVGPCHVQIIIYKRGTESHISVYAELDNGVKS